METVFFGAGASKHFNVPTMNEFPEDFEKYLEDNEEYKEKSLYKKIKGNLKEDGDLDPEVILTVLEDLSEKERFDRRFEHPSILYLLEKGRINRIHKLIDFNVMNDGKIAKLLKEKLKGFIRKKCIPENFKDNIQLYTEFFNLIMPDYNLKNDIGRREHKGRHCEIFTTNYDLCIENYCRMIKMPFRNGEKSTNGKYIVSLSKKSNKVLYSNDFQGFQIYKLHGSVNWYKIRDSDIRDFIHWASAPLEVGATTFDYTEIESELIIYPVQEKQIYKDPFSDMFIRLKESLELSKYCFVVGYSFRDEEIRGIFDDAMFARDKKELKTKIFLIDPCAKAIIKNRLESINKLDNIEIKPINKEFSIDAINELQEPHHSLRGEDLI
jgi:hypothetical protein